MSSRDSLDAEESVMTVKYSRLSVILVLLASGVLQATDEPTPAAEPHQEVAAAALAVGELLPEFQSTDEQGLPWKSKDHVGKKVLVLYFYPGDFTAGCSKQARIYRDELMKIEELGGEIVGISGDEVATHTLFKETFELKHSLLADSKGELAQLVGVPVSAGGCVRGAHADRTPILNDNGTTIILRRPLTVARWTVVVGRDGKVASIRSSVDPLTDCEEVCRIVASMAR